MFDGADELLGVLIPYDAGAATQVTCPHCGDTTEQDMTLEEWTCGACDKPFSLNQVRIDTLPIPTPTPILLPDHTIIRVAPENITPLWPQVEPLMQLGIHGVPTHTTEDVRHQLMSMAAHLWIQWADRVEAVCVTQFMAYPTGVWLRVWLGAVYPQHKFDTQGFYNTVTAFRRANNCRGLEVVGRVGWMKLFPQARLEGVLLRETDVVGDME